MRHFNSIKEALNYCQGCPLCQQALQCNKSIHISSYGEMCIVVSEFLELTIDSYGINIIKFTFNNLDLSHDYFTVESFCDTCSYYYNFDVYFSYQLKMITSIFLVHEYIWLKPNISIMNMYISQKTSYANHSSPDHIQLPLIEIDHDNPHKILDKIQKLLPFT